MTPLNQNQNKKTSHKKVLETALSRFKNGMSAESEMRRLSEEDMSFRAGDQWPDEIKRQREVDGRPCLTINKIPQNVHQITNDQRQNRARIKVTPFDDVADPETAKVLQGVIRNIENNSNANTAYDVAIDWSVTTGRGFFRVVTEYSDPMSFEQDIRIKSIPDTANVLLDPSYKNPDGSDANWGFVFEDVPKDEFEAQYPDCKASSSDFKWSEEGNTDWFNEDTYRIADYYCKEYRKDKLYKLPDNSTALESEIKKMPDEFFLELGVERDDYKELEYRETQVLEIKWYKLCGNEIIDSTDWVSTSWIPIIPVHGVELWVKGKRNLEGIIRHAKDPQRMYNYWATCETEAIALAPKTPFIGAEGSFEGHEYKWESAHLKNFPYLEYKPTTLDNGQPAPAPQRQFAEANVQAITQARMLSSDDLKSTTGIYDASLGNRSNEQSGVAITSRTRQSQTGNFHFIDNLSRSINHLGRILVEIIPKIYDTERTIRIIGPEDNEEIVKINQVFKNDKGEDKKFDLSLGKYDVNTTTGPSFSSKRQEAVESMLTVSRHNPQVMSVAGDLFLKNLDIPGADEIAARIKRTIPPEILGNDKDQEIPASAKAQMEEMGAMIEKLSTQLKETSESLEENDHKIKEKLIDIESRERIEMAKIERDLAIKHAELQARSDAAPNQLTQIERELNEANRRSGILGIDDPVDQDLIAEQLEMENQNINLPGEVPPEITGQEPMGEN